MAVYFSVLVIVSLLIGNTNFPFALPLVNDPFKIDNSSVSKLALISDTRPFGKVMMFVAFTFIVIPWSSIMQLFAIICVGFAPVFQVSGRVRLNFLINKPCHKSLFCAEVSPV